MLLSNDIWKEIERQAETPTPWIDKVKFNSISTLEIIYEFHKYS